MTNASNVGQRHPTVLFIAGDGRSGSTILHGLLGQLPRVAAVGEIREIWARGFGQNYMCGCGQLFRYCSHWNAVAEDAFGGMDRVDHSRLSELTEHFRTKDLLLTSVLGDRKLSQVSELIEALDQLYRSIATVTGSDVIVDSSKNPSFGYLVERIPRVRVKVLHFIRDGRAVAYSWLQHKESEPGKALRRQSASYSALQWDVRNLTTELYLRGEYRRMRYEDFMADPEGQFASLARWLDRDAENPPVSGRVAHLAHANHSVFGNGIRFAAGDVPLEEDVRWTTNMSARDRRVASLLTSPVRVRYGYGKDRSEGRTG